MSLKAPSLLIVCAFTLSGTIYLIANKLRKEERNSIGKEKGMMILPRKWVWPMGRLKALKQSAFNFDGVLCVSLFSNCQFTTAAVHFKCLLWCFVKTYSNRPLEFCLPVPPERGRGPWQLLVKMKCHGAIYITYKFIFIFYNIWERTILSPTKVGTFKGTKNLNNLQQVMTLNVVIRKLINLSIVFFLIYKG